MKLNALMDNFGARQNATRVGRGMGSGSGKTAVLTARTQRKLLSGTHVNELLVLTFTNAAAAEMKERIEKETGEKINQTIIHK